jgi:lipoprotein-anchoring transpeptidase ErfK/SrfK
MRKLVLTSAIAVGALMACNSVQAQTFASLLSNEYAPQPQQQYVLPQAYAPQQQQAYAPAQADDEAAQDAQLDPRLRRQIVDYRGKEAPGTIIVDTPNTFLYLVLGDGKAIRYGIGVGREGFTWSGTHPIVRKAEWPDWYPPQEMIERQPYLPRMTAGGPGNPLGARAMYIGGTVYRIHGTNDPTTIGKNVSSGCIRLTNEDVTDLYERVKVGAKVVVLPQTNTAQRKMPASESYAPVRESNAARTWASIRPSGLY